MIDLERWILELDDGEEREAQRQQESSEALFEQYVLRKDTPYRRELLEQYRSGAALTGILWSCVFAPLFCPGIPGVPWGAG